MTFTQLSNQETYLTIHEDGRIEVSENLQPSETAALVLECMRTKWMADAQSIKIRDQQERIERLEELGNELRGCASMIGWSSSENSRWIARAESAVKAWDKEAKP